MYMYCSFIQPVITFRAGRLIRIKPKSQYGLWYCGLVVLVFFSLIMCNWEGATNKHSKPGSFPPLFNHILNCKFYQKKSQIRLFTKTCSPNYINAFFPGHGLPTCQRDPSQRYEIQECILWQRESGHHWLWPVHNIWCSTSRQVCKNTHKHASRLAMFSKEISSAHLGDIFFT